MLRGRTSVSLSNPEIVTNASICAVKHVSFSRGPLTRTKSRRSDGLKSTPTNFRDIKPSPWVSSTPNQLQSKSCTRRRRVAVSGSSGQDNLEHSNVTTSRLVTRMCLHKKVDSHYNKCTPKPACVIKTSKYGFSTKPTCGLTQNPHASAKT